MNVKRYGFWGERYNRLTVIREAPMRNKQRYVECECDCGTMTTVALGLLRRGNTKSCGCLRREGNKEITGAAPTHGMSGSREYAAWKAMRSRCQNPSAPIYSSYGGRGVSVCPRWNDFSNFLSDMGSCPSGMSLDRIDNDGDYGPGNCRWATPTEQANNKRRTIWLTNQGERRPLADWARAFGLTYDCLYHRLKRRGWDLEAALVDSSGGERQRKVS